MECRDRRKLVSGHSCKSFQVSMLTFREEPYGTTVKKQKNIIMMQSAITSGSPSEINFTRETLLHFDGINRL